MEMRPCVLFNLLFIRKDIGNIWSTYGCSVILVRRRALPVSGTFLIAGVRDLFLTRRESFFMSNSNIRLVTRVEFLLEYNSNFAMELVGFSRISIVLHTVTYSTFIFPFSRLVAGIRQFINPVNIVFQSIIFMVAWIKRDNLVRKKVDKISRFLCNVYVT